MLVGIKILYNKYYVSVIIIKNFPQNGYSSCKNPSWAFLWDTAILHKLYNCLIWFEIRMLEKHLNLINHSPPPRQFGFDAILINQGQKSNHFLIFSTWSSSEFETGNS